MQAFAAYQLTSLLIRQSSACLYAKMAMHQLTRVSTPEVSRVAAAAPTADVERNNYMFPCTLLTEAQLIFLALSLPGQALLATDHWCKEVALLRLPEWDNYVSPSCVTCSTSPLPSSILTTRRSVPKSVWSTLQCD
jgi:hypothetical protein